MKKINNNNNKLKKFIMSLVINKHSSCNKMYKLIKTNNNFKIKTKFQYLNPKNKLLNHKFHNCKYEHQKIFIQNTLIQNQ